MLAVYGLRREEFSTLEAARLMDGYARRMRWEAQVLAAAVWGALGDNALTPAAGTPLPSPGGRGVGRGERVGSREFLERVGAKIWD